MPTLCPRANHDLESSFKQMRKEATALQAQIDELTKQVARLEKSKVAAEKAKEQMGRCLVVLCKARAAD